ncbi:AbrB/MazE/SpoVT family DNA-binding domain-containing protein [Streptacidiphilus sp. MAP5-3]|uniref:AbrB/MazE/SpoVT family DNA-binding domain-containing protein n=1 Tax=unclassified Streptacidiphilus TaxID=2643834 RepID=UPI0035149FBC
MTPTASEVDVDEHGAVVLPLSVLAEAGIAAGERLLAVAQGDGRIVLRRLDDAVDSLMHGLPL